MPFVYQLYIVYFYVTTLKRMVNCQFLFSGQFRTPFQTKWRPKTFDDVIIPSDVIYVTPKPVAILLVTLVTTAMFTMKMQTFV